VRWFAVDRRRQTPAVDTREVAEALLALRRAALSLEMRRTDDLARIPADDRASAQNLIHYLAVRQFDIRELQRALALRGLSSLGRAESHVLASIDAVIGNLVAFGVVEPPSGLGTSGPTAARGAELLERHTVDALGPPPGRARARLMVTMPSAAVHDRSVIEELVGAGMDIARINCAHDGPVEWRSMAESIRSVSAEVGRRVLVAFDLAGPKLRTGPLPPGPRVVKIRPERSVEGHVTRPASVRFVDVDGLEGPNPTDAGAREPAVVRVEGLRLLDIAGDDEIRVLDHRGRRRSFRVIECSDDSVLATTERTSYVVPGLAVECRRDDEVVGRGVVGPVPPTDAFIPLSRGDRLDLVRGEVTGRAARLAEDGSVLEPAMIGCPVDAVFAAVLPGHRVLLDDGSIEAVVTEVDGDHCQTVVIRPDRAKLRAGKGINLPDTRLATAALTPDDVEALRVVAPLADIVQLSYVSDPEDVSELRALLQQHGRPDVTLVLKIETVAAFTALPNMLMQVLEQLPAAVMVARGDLAVEAGFPRLAEVQEEILWLCEAAHVPVIWATQVLESLAKGGVPTRAEVTDAAWAGRAECVMLNKGPHIAEAMRFLDDVFGRMQSHQRKRTPLLRRLSLSTAFGEVDDDRG
jgi:pyruvate kinase